MTNEWEQAGDFLEDRFQAHRLPGPLVTAEAAALAAFALTVVSLFLVGAGNAIAESASFGLDGSTKVLAVIPGMQALIAFVGVWLGRLGTSKDGVAMWTGSVARAALLIGGVSLVVNLTAFGFALSS